MAILIKPREISSHWYTADGRPAHRQEKRDGDGDRPTTITDARRLGLIPSVTNILGVLAKPALDKWRMAEVAKAALRVPPPAHDEPIERFAKRAIDAAFEQVQDAADLGTHIHAALECGLAGEPYDDQLAVFVDPVFRWKAERKIEFTERELVVVNQEVGYAGKCDVFFTWPGGGLGILDWKTKRTTPGQKVEAWPEYGMQLAAYAAAHYGVEALPVVLAANVIISTTEPGRLDIVKHDGLGDLYLAFQHVAAIWRFLKCYDPIAKEAP